MSAGTGMTVLVAMLLPGPLAHVEVALKCGSTEPPLIAIDGEIIELDGQLDSLEGHVGAGEVYWIEIVCFDGITFTARHGRPVVSVWTRSGPVAQLEPTLSSVLAAQTSHREAHGSYAEELGDLGVTASDARIELSLYADEGGWLATAGVERFLGRCYVFDGQAPSPHPTVKRGKPTCLDRQAAEEARRWRRSHTPQRGH